MDVGGHYNREEELTSCEGASEIIRGRRLETTMEKQSREVDDLMLNETLI